jgi:hypothetical protein
MSAMPVVTSEEMRVAEQLLARIAPERGELVCDDDHILSFRVSRDGWRLSRLIFSRQSLRKLADDPMGRVKLDWLAHDITRSATRRRSYVFPNRLRLRG